MPGRDQNSQVRVLPLSHIGKVLPAAVRQPEIHHQEVEGAVAQDRLGRRDAHGLFDVVAKFFQYVRRHHQYQWLVLDDQDTQSTGRLRDLLLHGTEHGPDLETQFVAGIGLAQQLDVLIELAAMHDCVLRVA